MSLDKKFPASVKSADMGNRSGKIAVRFKTGFTFALVLLVVTMALAAKTSRDNASARQWVFHTHEVIECVTELTARASERELGMRNYVRTGDARFRERYDALDRETNVLGDRLVALVSDNPPQIQHAQQIRTLIEERGRAIAALLNAYTPANSEHVLAANVMPSSSALDAMDGAISSFRDEERRLLDERQARLDSSAKLIDQLIPMIGLTGLFVLVGCQIALSRYFSQARRAQAATLAATQMADKANKFKSAFLANVSHEIRTPLAAILGYTDMLRGDKPSSPEDRDDYLRTIQRNGEQMLTIVNDILDLSKIEAGRMTVERIPCGIVEVIADVASLFRRVAADRGLFFEVKYIDPIPAQIRTDPTRLRQVLMNLVGNAVKFTEHGGVRLVVDVIFDGAVSRLLRVRVVDTGIGVSTEAAATLFHPFIQADISTTRRFGGTGLGLTISRHFAELLGGTINVESEIGRGSTFTLTVATGDLAGIEMLTGVTEVSRDSHGSAVMASPRLNGLRVLVAEDGLDNRQIILFYLRQAGAEVMVAENGKAAVQLATEMAKANRPFDLILMDMQMPVMDGYTATTTLRNSRYTGPIVALTANAMAHDREKCLTAGCNGFITKPILWPEFWTTIRRFLTNPSATTAAVRSGAAQLVTVPTPTLIMDPGAKELPGAAIDKLAQLMAKLAAALPERVTDIRLAFEQQDRPKMKLLAHALSGAAASYGFPETGELAHQLDLNYDVENSRVLDMLKALDLSILRRPIPTAA
jgi:signal transduction histidine kinase/DNA-binding response OmpR family regulator